MGRVWREGRGSENCCNYIIISTIKEKIFQGPYDFVVLAVLGTEP